MSAKLIFRLFCFRQNRIVEDISDPHFLCTLRDKMQMTHSTRDGMKTGAFYNRMRIKMKESEILKTGITDTVKEKRKRTGSGY